MDLPENLFKAALLERRRVLGTWLMMDSPVAAEALAFAGFDFLVVDTEHAPGGAPEARAQLQAIAGGSVSAVVRLVAGPGDLSASLGVIGQVDHPEVLVQVQAVLRAARQAGKAAGVLAANEGLAEHYASLGFDFIAVASDLAFMTSTARAAAARLRARPG